MMRPRPAPPAAKPAKWGMAEYFIVSQTAIPAVLFLPGFQGVRMYVRVASFAISIALLAWWAFGSGTGTRRSATPHPAQPWLFAFLVYAGVMVMHPFTSSTLGGVAQLVLYCSVMAPLFWVAVDRAQCRSSRAADDAAAGLQRHQCVRRRHAGLRSESLDAAGDVAHRHRLRIRSRRGELHGTERTHRAAAGTFRYTRRRRRSGDVRGPARPRLRDQRAGMVEAGRRARRRVRRRRRHLLEPGARVAGRARRDAWRVRDGADAPPADEARLDVRRDCRRDRDRHLLVCRRARRREHHRAYLHALRAGSGQLVLRVARRAAGLHVRRHGGDLPARRGPGALGNDCGVFRRGRADVGGDSDRGLGDRRRYPADSPRHRRAGDLPSTRRGVWQSPIAMPRFARAPPSSSPPTSGPPRSSSASRPSSRRSGCSSGSSRGRCTRLERPVRRAVRR